MKDRLKRLREHLNMNQRDFSNKINISQSSLAMMENGQRQIRDIHVSQMCSEFNVNETWLRTGEGEMFVQPSTFSLDDYAKKHNLTELEILIVKGYMELDQNVRDALIQRAKELFSNHSEIVATVEEKEDEKEIAEIDVDIEDKVEKYRQMLETEKKIQRSLASQEQKKYG